MGQRSILKNTAQNQYFAQRGCKLHFNADKFDENLAQDRITRVEVQKVFDDMNKVCPDYSKY